MSCYVLMPCWFSWRYVLGRLWHHRLGTVSTVPASLLRFGRSPLGWWLAIVSDIVPDKSIMFAAKYLSPFLYQYIEAEDPATPVFLHLFRWVSAFANFPRCCGRRAFLVRCLPAVNKQLGQFPEDEKHCLFRLPIGLASLYLDWVCSSRMTSDDRHCNYLDGHVLTGRPQIIFDPYSCWASCQITLLACWIMKILNEQLLKPSCLILFDGYILVGDYTIQYNGNNPLGESLSWGTAVPVAGVDGGELSGHRPRGMGKIWEMMGAGMCSQVDDHKL
jgi:hypothetical protein